MVTGRRLMAPAIVALAAVMLTGLLPAPPAEADPKPDSPDLFGISQTPTWRADTDDWHGETGEWPELFQLFWTLDMDMSGNWIPGMLGDIYDDRGGMIPVIEITPSTIQDEIPLSQLLNGSLDDELDTLVNQTVAWLDENAAHKVLIAPLPESNVSTHPWSDGPANYIAGYNKIRDAFLDHTSNIGPDQIRFLFWVNGLNSGYPNDYAPWYPGDDKVDLIGFSKINRGGSDWRDYDNVFTIHIQQLQAQIGPYKPILIAQTATVVDEAGSSAWLIEMMTKIPNEDQVVGLIYFNRLSGDCKKKCYDFRIHPEDGSVRPEVKNNLDNWGPAGQGEWLFGSMDAWVQWRIDNLPDRFWGSNRYATAVAVSQETHPGGADTVYLAVGTNYPDAIAAGPLAASDNAPILLVTATTLPTQTRDELIRLSPATVVILGGTAAISNDVKTAVEAAVSGVNVQRIGGTNRYDTARLISEAAFPDPVGNPIETVFIVTGQNFPDALSAASTAVVKGFGLLLVNPTSVPPVIAAELARLDPDKVLILGGTAAVSAAVEAELKAIVPNTTRITAPNRYALPAELSERYFTSPVGNVMIAVGDNFPDALAGGPAALVFPGPMLLVLPDSIPAEAAAELERLDPANIIILGGSAVVSVGVQSQLAEYVVTP